MHDIQYHDELDLDFEFLDDVGQPAPVENVEVFSSNTDVLEVIPNGDGRVTIRPTGAIAEASVTIRADAHVGSGEDPFFDIVEFNVTAGRARRVNVNVGAPRRQEKYNQPTTTPSPTAPPPPGP